MGTVFFSQIRRMFLSPSSKRAALYLKPLREAAERGRMRVGFCTLPFGFTLTSHSQQGSQDSESDASNAAPGAADPRSGGDGEAGGGGDQVDLKSFLRSLVYKANFLVEENLNLLVEADDILDDERALFRLDSILATIGVEQEAEIAAVLAKHRANPSRAKMEILRVIRGHVEKATSSSAAAISSSSSTSSPRLASTSSAAAVPAAAASRKSSTSSSSSSGAARRREEEEKLWSVMVRSVEQLLDDDRQVRLPFYFFLI